MIGANTSITFHFFRDLRLAEAGEAGMDRPDMSAGAGHSQGSQATNYRATVGPWTLAGAGYKHGKDPEMLAAYVRALYRELDGNVSRLVDMLYERHRPRLLQLESEATASGSTAGERMRDWLHMVRHCIGAWVVSTASRPRDRFCRLDEDSPAKRHLVAPELCPHLASLVLSSEYASLESTVLGFENAEIEMGDLAFCSGQERRIRAQQTGMERRLVDLPEQLASRVQPQIDAQAEQTALAADLAYRNSLEDDHVDKRLEHGSRELREARMAHAEQKRASERSQLTLDVYGGVFESSPKTCDRCIAEGTVGKCVHMMPRKLIAQKPTAGLLPPTRTSPALPAPSDLGPIALLTPPVVVASSESHVPSDADSVQALRAQLAEKDRQLATLRQRGEGAPDVKPLHLGRLTSVSHMLRIFLQSVAPKEREGSAWRGSKVLGQKGMQEMSDLITKQYLPVLYAVAKARCFAPTS